MKYAVLNYPFFQCFQCGSVECDEEAVNSVDLLANALAGWVCDPDFYVVLPPQRFDLFDGIKCFTEFPAAVITRSEIGFYFNYRHY